MIIRNNNVNKIVRYNGFPVEVFFPDPSGGTITTDGNYKTHTFDISGNFIVYWKLDASALAVGGGSGAINARFGIASYTGGGGGGKLVENYNLHFPAGTYEIVVGKGGVGGNGTVDCRYGSSGGNSSIVGLLDASGAYSNYGAIPPSAVGGISSARGLAGGLGASNAGGGGGGDANAGTNGAANARGGDGGSGSLSKITGQRYGGGGLGRCNVTQGNPGDGSIGRGAAGNVWGQALTTGSDGVVIIRYKYK